MKQIRGKTLGGIELARACAGRKNAPLSPERAAMTLSANSAPAYAMERVAEPPPALACDAHKAHESARSPRCHTDKP
jgi:hypothetical protein